MALGRIRAGRRTNLALLALLVGATVTGALAFALGSGWVRWAVVAHGAIGFGVVLLAPWKTGISARGVRHHGRGSWPSLALAGLVLIAVVSGIGHATGLLRSVAGLKAMQIHIGASLLALPLVIWHVVARPVRPRATDLSRRTLVRAGALAGGSLAIWGGVEGAIRLARLPGAGRRATGSFELGSGEPVEMPVTQWLNDAVPTVDPAEWSLTIRVGGRDRSLAYDRLTNFDDRVHAVLDCTGGWYSEQEWAGVRVDRLLGDVPSEGSILVRSVTGYGRRFPTRDAAQLVLATRAAGDPLSPGHGAPLRLAAPGRRGFWWVKWVTSIEVDQTPWWWQPPFPLA